MKVKYLPKYYGNMTDQLWEVYLLSFEIVKPVESPDFGMWDSATDFLENYFPLEHIIPESCDVVQEYKDRVGIKLVIEDFNPKCIDDQMNDYFYRFIAYLLFTDHDEYLQYTLKTKGLDKGRLDNLLEVFND